MNESTAVTTDDATDAPFVEGLGFASLGAAILGIAINDSGVIDGTGQGNLAVTIPLAVAGIAGAFFARAYYRRLPVRSRTRFASHSLRQPSNYAVAMLLVLVVLVRSALPAGSARSAIGIITGMLLIVAGVRGHVLQVRAARTGIRPGA